MIRPLSAARAYRRFGYLALAHALAILGLLALFFELQSRGLEGVWFRHFWIGLVTLWFLWPVVLAFHRGWSALRLGVFALLSAVLLWPSLQTYYIYAPEALGLPWGMKMSPVSALKYSRAYLAGRSDAKKDVSAGILAIEDASLVPGHERWDGRILHERFQIEIKTIAGSIVDETSIGHQAGYNSVSIREIDRRFGWDRVQAARDDALQERYVRSEQLVKELTKRLSTIPPDAKVAVQLIRVCVNGWPPKDATTEQRLAPFVHAIEQIVMDAVPEDTPAFELHVSAALEPSSRPSFQISGSANSPQPVSQAISTKLDAMPLPDWSEGSLSAAFDFLIRPPR
jgi:hypothetical protein